LTNLICRKDRTTQNKYKENTYKIRTLNEFSPSCL